MPSPTLEQKSSTFALNKSVCFFFAGPPKPAGKIWSGGLGKLPNPPCCERQIPMLSRDPVNISGGGSFQVAHNHCESHPFLDGITISSFYEFR